MSFNDLNPLLNNRCLDVSKLKAFTDDKRNDKTGHCKGRKQQNNSNQHFSFFHNSFSPFTRR